MSELITCGGVNDHYCTYIPQVLVDGEGYLYEGGICCVCGKETTRNYNLNLKNEQRNKI